MFVCTFDIELWSLTYIRREADPFFFVYYIRSCGIVCVCVLSAYPSIEFAELGLHRGEKQVHLSQCISFDVAVLLMGVCVCALSISIYRVYGAWSA